MTFSFLKYNSEGFVSWPCVLMAFPFGEGRDGAGVKGGLVW